MPDLVRTERPRCAFIPPYLLRHVASATDQATGSPARQTLRTDIQLRAERPRGDRDSRSLLAGISARAAGETRVVHSADSTENLPGRRVRGDDDPPSADPAVDESFDSSGEVLALFADQFARDSIDGRGGVVSITVHYGDRYDNAFWDGQQLVFGDGDGEIFDRFTKPMDVMAHEFTHGVTQFTAGLAYEGQSGALNESVSDVFAAMTKQRAAGQTAAEADWLIGEGLFLPGINAKALRSMSAPGTAYDDPRIGRDPQVASMADYVETEEDDGGVHINSGIPNRAFSLTAVAIGGFSWERAGKIWYETMTGGAISATSDFTDFARATVSAAGRLFPEDVTVAQKVRTAWAEVMVLPAPTGDPVDAVQRARHAGSRSGDPLSPTGADRISVRRTGGVAGVSRAAEIDLADDPNGPELRRLLRQSNLGQSNPEQSNPEQSKPEQGRTITRGPDRFVYTVEYGQIRLTLPEQDLTPELHQMVRIVLAAGRPPKLS